MFCKNQKKRPKSCRGRNYAHVLFAVHQKLANFASSNRINVFPKTALSRHRHQTTTSDNNSYT